MGQKEVMVSGYYEMDVVIRNYDPTQEEAIQAAAGKEWCWTEWDVTADSTEMRSSGRGNLTGGEAEKTFSERAAIAVWKANGAYCEIEITAVYLENPPREDYGFDEFDYRRLTATQAVYVSVWDEAVTCRSACTFDPRTRKVSEIETALNQEDAEACSARTDEYVEVNGKQLRERDGIVFAYKDRP